MRTLIRPTTLLLLFAAASIVNGQTAEQFASLQKLEAQRKTDAVAAEVAKARLEATDKQIAAIRAVIDGKEAPTSDDNSKPAGGKTATALFRIAEDYHLRVRHTLQDTKENKEPALFQYTHPVSGRASWAADIGLGFGNVFDWDRSISWGMENEYHYNTAAGSLKDSLSIAAAIGGHFGDRTQTGANWKVDAGYREDNLIAGQGLTVGLTVLPTVRALKMGLWTLGDDTNWLKGRIEPFFGVEFETGNGASDKFADGQRITGRAGLSVAGWILPSHFGERLEVLAKLSYWGNADRTGFYQQYRPNQLYFTASTTYWLDTGVDKDGKLRKNFGITARYETGDNPSEGSFNQNVWTLGFAVKF